MVSWVFHAEHASHHGSVGPAAFSSQPSKHQRCVHTQTYTLNDINCFYCDTTHTKTQASLPIFAHNYTPMLHSMGPHSTVVAAAHYTYNSVKMPKAQCGSLTIRKMIVWYVTVFSHWVTLIIAHPHPLLSSERVATAQLQ